MSASGRAALGGTVAAAFAVLAVHVARFCSLPYGEKLSFVPDDAFYYFELGREHARAGLWSFDRGRTLTSGFHVAQGWLASSIEGTFPGDGRLDARMVAYAIVAALATALALAVAAVATRRLFPGGALAAMLFVGFAGGSFILPLQAMEWPLVVLALALALFGLVTERLWLFVAAMFLGPLCRTDFVVVAACLGVTGLIERRALSRSRAAARRLLLGFGASMAGAAVVSLHTYLISGEVVQSSARTKAFWGSVTGYQPLYGLEPSSYAFGPGLILTRTLDFGPATLLVPVAILAGLWLALRREIASFEPGARLAARWAGMTLLVLPLLYGRVGLAAQCWYSALFVVPFFVVVAALGEAAAKRWPRAGPGVVAAGVLCALVNAYDARRPVWNAGPYFAELGHVRADESIERLASWNAGRLGYLAGERTTNIDGLVNDDVYAYLVADRIHCYLVHERIGVIVDQLEWFEKRSRMLGGGNGKLRAALSRRPISGSILEAYDVDLATLARDPACAEDLRSHRSRTLRPATLPGYNATQLR